MRCCIGTKWSVPGGVWYTRHIHFARLDELKGQLLEMGICEVLIPLTNSPSSEVQGNSAAALGNLSSKGINLSQALRRELRFSLAILS
jgi:hypothetical protein